MKIVANQAIRRYLLGCTVLYYLVRGTYYLASKTGAGCHRFWNIQLDICLRWFLPENRMLNTTPPGTAVLSESGDGLWFSVDTEQQIYERRPFASILDPKNDG